MELYATLAFVFSLTIFKPRLSLYLFILASPFVSVYQAQGWDPRVGWALFLGLRAMSPDVGKHADVNFRILLAGVVFFVVSATVLRFNMASIPLEDASSAWSFFLYFLSGSFFVFAASRLVGDKQEVVRTLCCLGLSAAGVALYAIWQGYQSYANDQYGRIGSTMINPNFLASYMGICAMGLLSARHVIDTRQWRIFVWSVSAAATLALILSFSRAGLMAFAVGSLLLWATASGKFSFKKAALVATVSVVMALSAYTVLRTYRIQRAAAQMKQGQESLVEVSQSMEDFTRYEAATFALEQWVDHPWFGIGFETFAAVNYQEKGFFVTTHNTLLQLLVGTGVIGVLLMLYVAKQVWARLRNRGKMLFLPALGCFIINSMFADFFGAIEMMAAISLAYLFCFYQIEADAGIKT
jgi:O-antigen ligase